MDKSKAYCPASLSFIFKYIPHKNLHHMGSIGIGCTLDKGVTVTVSQSEKTDILFNNNPITFPTVFSVIKKLTPVKLLVEINSSLPLGFGFGISAASSLATAIATNKLLNLGKKTSELTAYAHIAEINNKTGLGSIGTLSVGGFLSKSTAGIPFKYDKYPFIGQKIYATLVSRIETPSVLDNKDQLNRIAVSADSAMDKFRLLSFPTLSNILDISYLFVLENGLLTDPSIKSIISNIRSIGGHATMAILGHVVLSDIKPKNLGMLRVEELTISEDTAHIINI